MKNTIVDNKTQDIGGAGVISRDTKIWTDSCGVKERMNEELRKTTTVIHVEGVKWADDKEAKADLYKL